MHNYCFSLFFSCRRMPILRLSVQHLVPTATHVMSATRYFAPSQKYVHAVEIAPSLSQLSLLILHCSRWNVSLQLFGFLFCVCRLTSCWSLSSAAHLCKAEFWWSLTLPGRLLKQQVLHTACTQFTKIQAIKNMFSSTATVWREKTRWGTTVFSCRVLFSMSQTCL